MSSAIGEAPTLTYTDTGDASIDAPPRKAGVEELILWVLLFAMMIVPPLEILLRLGPGKGLSNAPSIVQHLVLVAGMLGAALAARQGRLISLGTAEALIPKAWREHTGVATTGVSVAITGLLGLAAAQFVASERTAPTLIAYGVPSWVAELALPVGFGLIAVRLLLHSSKGWLGRAVATVIAVTLATLVYRAGAAPGFTLIAFITLGVATLLGAPLFIVLAGAALILFRAADSPLSSLTVDHYGLATNPTIPTVPLFTLAGCFLAEGGASKRLIRVFSALVGNIRGGPAVLVAIVCAFFTSFTGASGVTILALGGLLMPVLLSAGYSERTSLGLLTGTGSLGLLFPPCAPLIFYAVIAGVDIRAMFLGGILPGVLLLVLTAAWGISQAPPRTGPRKPMDWGEAGRAAWEAKWELLLPVIALGSMLSGLATPVEAAALTACYACFIETVIYRDLHPWRDLPRVTAEAGVLVGGVLLILGVALGFTNYLAFAEVPSRAVDWVTGSVHSAAMFLLLLNLFLLVVGMLMDIFSAIVVVVPLIVPLGRAFGIDPVHLGIVFLANLELGYLTPPVGQNLFLASLRFRKPMATVFRAAIPMLVVFAIGVVLITYMPLLTTTLPRLVSAAP